MFKDPNERDKEDADAKWAEREEEIEAGG